MNQNLVTLVAFAVNAVAFWALFIIFMLGINNLLYIGVATAVAFGLAVYLYFLATGQGEGGS